MSNISIGQIISDAQRIANRVKDLDSLGSALLVEAESNNRLVESLRQFQDDMDSLNRVSNNKSNTDIITRIQLQNANSSEVLKENRELKVCIEDYERTMDLIMHKYREHASSKVINNKINFKEVYNDKLCKIIREQGEKIHEMAAVMQRVAAMDEQSYIQDLETMTRLRMENNALRELLQISKHFSLDGRPTGCNAHMLEDKGVQTEVSDAALYDDSADELSLSGASVKNANNNTAIHVSSLHMSPLNSTATNHVSPSNENNNGPIAQDSAIVLDSSSKISMTNSDNGNMGLALEATAPVAIKANSNMVNNDVVVTVATAPTCSGDAVMAGALTATNRAT